MTPQGDPTTAWQLEEAASDAYERYLVPPMFQPWANRLLDAIDIHDDARILDLACGTGIVARCAATRTNADATIVGLDVNEGMLATAQAHTTNDHETIEWRQGDAHDVPFPEASFDAALCQQALQFFEEPGTAIKEIHRVLAPGGSLAASIWRPLDHQPGYTVLAQALEQHIGDDAGAMMRSPFPDWDLEHVRGLARKAGFEDAHITVQIGTMRYPSVEAFVRREAASSPLAEPIRNTDATIIDALLQDVENDLDAYRDDEGIVFPMETHVLTAQR